LQVETNSQNPVCNGVIVCQNSFYQIDPPLPHLQSLSLTSMRVSYSISASPSNLICATHVDLSSLLNSGSLESPRVGIQEIEVLSSLSDSKAALQQARNVSGKKLKSLPPSERPKLDEPPPSVQELEPQRVSGVARLRYLGFETICYDQKD